MASKPIVTVVFTCLTHRHNNTRYVYCHSVGCLPLFSFTAISHLQCSVEQNIHSRVWQEKKAEIQVHGWAAAAEDGHSGAAGWRCWLLEVAVLQDCSRVWHEQVEETSWTHQPSHWAAQSNRAGSQVRDGAQLKKKPLKNYSDETPGVYDLFNVPDTWFHSRATWVAWEELLVVKLIKCLPCIFFFPSIWTSEPLRWEKRAHYFSGNPCILHSVAFCSEMEACRLCVSNIL